jgi:hypothetical protein
MGANDTSPIGSMSLSIAGILGQAACIADCSENRADPRRRPRTTPVAAFRSDRVRPTQDYPSLPKLSTNEGGVVSARLPCRDGVSWTKSRKTRTVRGEADATSGGIDAALRRSWRPFLMDDYIAGLTAGATKG